jgi:hypothetical protein
MDFLFVDSFDVADGLFETEEKRTSLNDVLAKGFNFTHFLETVHNSGVDGDILRHFTAFAL